MHWRVLLGSMAWLTSATEGTSAITDQYLLNAETVVHAESAVGKYDRTLHTEISASLQQAASEVLLEVRRDSYICILRGALAGHTVALIQGQKCPQSIKGEGFQADLDGTLTSGSATIGPHELILTTNWDVHGTVKLGPLSIPVTGTVSTVATGPKT